MEQVLEVFQFSTAAPFGYAVFYGLCLVAALVSAWAIITAVVRKKFISLRFIGGGLVLALVAITVYANYILAAQLDLNPFFTEKDVAGQWQDGTSRIILREDNTARFDFSDDYKGREPVLSGVGTWHKTDDFEIGITPAGNAQPMKPPLRVIESGGELRIIVEDFDDPDEWDRHLGFKRTPAARLHQ